MGHKPQTGEERRISSATPRTVHALSVATVVTGSAMPKRNRRGPAAHPNGVRCEGGCRRRIVLRPAVKDTPCCRVYNMDEFFVLQAPSGRWTYGVISSVLTHAANGWTTSKVGSSVSMATLAWSCCWTRKLNTTLQSQRDERTASWETSSSSESLRR
jgi:hypothetical protein